MKDLKSTKFCFKYRQTEGTLYAAMAVDRDIYSVSVTKVRRFYLY
jgi:hypothetical protein